MSTFSTKYQLQLAKDGRPDTNRADRRRAVRSRSKSGGKHPYGKTTSTLSRWVNRRRA